MSMEVRDEFEPVRVSKQADGSVEVIAPHGAVRFAADGGVSLDGLALRCLPVAAGRAPDITRIEVALAEAPLARVVQHGELGDDVTFRVTFDVHQTPNVHVYVRLEASADVTLEALALPQIELEGATAARGVPGALAADVEGAEGRVGVVVKKAPWRARWNDVGCHGHGVLASARFDNSAPETLRLVAPTVSLAAGETIEAALFLRVHAGDGMLEREAIYGPLEAHYVPEGEYDHAQVWETEAVWLGPPIFEGCHQRPYDQLIPRVVGLDVLGRKRFTWNNEDFSLWRVTGKDRYRESGVKKAYALVATQNEHGGWYEGIEFYNLPPHHHHMYDTYIGGLFLLEAYDATGAETFLAAARRCLHFWVDAAPPANGHTEEAPGVWLYRWGGYVNEFGYTDERRVLNTHAGACSFLAQLAERTGDPKAHAALEAGIAGFLWALERGAQRGNGQLLYCLSQVDPLLERPGDPPYIKLDLVPQIEDVYTVATTYRLLVANRVQRDPALAEPLRRALDYWWTGYRAGTVYTYRAYAAIAYGLAAGELDLRYALALPEILRDPQHHTSMQHGLSTFVAPHGLLGLPISFEGSAGAGIEPIFLRRTPEEYLVAVVNLEQPVFDLPVRIGLPGSAQVQEIRAIDPADLSETVLPHEADDRTALVSVPFLQEFGVSVLSIRLA